MLLLREADVARLMTVADAVDLLDQAFAAEAQGQAGSVPRARYRFTNGQVANWMIGELNGMVGFKLYLPGGGRLTFLVGLFNPDGSIAALIEGDILGQIRTGAASGLATRYLAPAGPVELGIIGTSVQARTQALAVAAVRPIRRVRAYSRDAARRQAFAGALARDLGVEVEPAPDAESAVRGAQVVITATRSAEPVLAGEWLEPGCHINAVGSNVPAARELGDGVYGRCGLIVTDSVAQAQVESGDLIHAAHAGLIRWEEVRELDEMVAGTARRPGPDAVTLFKSHGVAVEDVAVARRLVDLARAAGAGEEIDAFRGFAGPPFDPQDYPVFR